MSAWFVHLRAHAKRGSDLNEGLPNGGEEAGGSDEQKDALSKSNRLVKALGATRIRDLSAVVVLGIFGSFYYGSQELSAFIERSIKASPALFGDGGLSERIKFLEKFEADQTKTNQDFEQRHRNAAKALKGNW